MPRIPASRPLCRLGLIGLATLCIALPAQAQWKWKDAAGKIQYSDLPPPNGTPEKDILQKPPGQRAPAVVVLPYGTAASAPTPAPPAASGPSKAELEQQAKQKAQEQEQQAKQKEEERRVAQQRRENCSRAQDNLRLLQEGTRLTRLNERGESVVIDDRQRAEEVQRTRGIVSSECR